MSNRFDVPPSSPSPSGAPAPSPSRGLNVSITRKHVLGVLGAGALIAAGALAYNKRDAIGPHARSAMHTLGSVGVNAVDQARNVNVLPETAADRRSQANALVNEDMAGSNNFDAQVQSYRLAHPNYRTQLAYHTLLIERRARATRILDQAARVLGKEDSRQSWGAFIEAAWDRPEMSPLLSTGMINGIAIALHRSSQEIGDANDQDAARVAFQLFSRAGWQTEAHLANVTDAAGLHYGVVTNLEREGITSFHVGRRALRNGAAELVADREFLAAINTRLATIQRVIEEKRTAGQLTLVNVRNALEAHPDNTAALANVPVEVTLAAVWTRLNVAGATIDNEILRLAVLGGRPVTTVLPVRDPIGGGLVKAHELVPNEVPDPTQFVAVR